MLFYAEGKVEKLKKCIKGKEPKDEGLESR